MFSANASSLTLAATRVESPIHGARAMTSACASRRRWTIVSMRALSCGVNASFT